MFDDSPAEDELPAPTEEDDGPWLVCKSCGAQIARRSWVVGVCGGQAERVFFNPNGDLMRIVTLLMVSQVRERGVPTDAFSWFPGYRWSYAQCAGCGIQLGWRFIAQGAQTPAAFWGLLVRLLVEDS